MYLNNCFIKMSLSVLGFIVFVASCRQGVPNHKTEKSLIKICTNLKSSPDKLQPYMTTSAYSNIVNQKLYPTLLITDPKDLELKPYLAKEVPSIERVESGEFEDFYRLAYELRPEVTWDNGSPVTGHDIAFALKMVQLPSFDAPVYRAYLKFIKEIVVDSINPSQFDMIIDEYYFKAQEMSSLAPLDEEHYDPNHILRKYTLNELRDHQEANKVLEKDSALQVAVKAWNSSTFTANPSGIHTCSAYTLDEWNDQALTLRKKEKWWGDSLSKTLDWFTANADMLRYEITNDQQTALNKMKEGYIDIIGSVNHSLGQQVINSTTLSNEIQRYQPESTKYYYIALNPRNPFLNSVHMRKALSHLVPYKQIIETLMFGDADRITGPILPVKSYYNHNINPIQHNVDKAIDLLKEAGWKDRNLDGILDEKNGKLVGNVEIEVLVSSGSTLLQDVIQLWSQSAKNAGVRIIAKPIAFNQLKKSASKGKFSAFALAAGLDLGMDDLYQQWHTDGITMGTNRSFFGNSVTDSLIERIRSDISNETRKKLYHRVQKEIYESYHVLFLFTPKEQILMRKSLQDVFVSPKYPGYFENYYSLVQDHAE